MFSFSRTLDFMSCPILNKYYFYKQTKTIFSVSGQIFWLAHLIDISWRRRRNVGVVGAGESFPALINAEPNEVYPDTKKREYVCAWALVIFGGIIRPAERLQISWHCSTPPRNGCNFARQVPQSGAKQIYKYPYKRPLIEWSGWGVVGATKKKF